MSKHYRILLGTIALSALLLSGCAKGGTDASAGSVSGSESAGGASSVSEPSAAPITFEGADLDGNAVTSDIFSQSKLTMVNVWATYCNPCLSEMPGLGELAAEYDPAEFQLIGIVSDVMEGEDQSLVESLIQETGADYLHLLANDSIGQAILSSVSGVPTTFFFDGEGAYLGGVVGSAEKEKWEEIIHGLLEQM